ncbi:MAG: CsbD family protein [Gemmatimonadales bacterium]|nr:CsbD family protein [Gemmatimonadales bacterium]
MTDRKHDDLESDGAENRVKGAAKELEGKVRSKVGDATDNGSEHAKGLGQQVKGKAQKNLGKAQEKIADALDDDF